MESQSSIEKNLLVIDKLTNENYPIWSFKIKAVMQEKDCWSAIEDKKPTDETKLAVWNKADIKALNTIILSVSNSQVIHIKNAKTAKEAWEALKEEHKKSGAGSKHRILKNIFQTTMKKGDSMRDHINVMMNYFDELTEMGSPLSADIAVSAILASLNDDYSSVVTAIEAWEEQRLTIKNVKSVLIEEYEKKKNQIEDKEVAMKIIQGFTNKHKDLECGYCHKMGHIKKDCYKRKKASENTSGHDEFAGMVRETTPF